MRTKATILIGTLICATLLGAPGAADPEAAEETPTRSVFEVKIDDKAVDVHEGRPTVVSIGDRDVTVTVVRKPLQPYETDVLAFEYSTEFSLKDDRDTEHRTIRLMHATGASVVVTDQGPANGVDADVLLVELVKHLHQAFARGKISEYKATKAQPVTYGKSSGKFVTITYVDEDGDAQQCDVHQLQSGGRVFSAVRHFEISEKADADRVTRPIFESIRGRAAQ